MMSGARFQAISGCGGDGIEASIYIVNIDGENLVLDVGYQDGMDIDKVLNQLKALDPAPRGILVTHAHLDHIGLLPCVHNIFPQTPIVMTPLTRILAKVILENALKLSPNLSLFLRSAADIKKTLDFCQHYERDFEGSIRIGSTEISILRAGHVPGAASFLIRGRQGTTILYTGDFSLIDFLTVPAATLPREQGFLDLLITEATYGDKNHLPRLKQIDDFVNNLRKVLERGGRVLIPSFALGRAQEILAILIKKMVDRDLDQYPVYLAGMALTMTREYDSHAHVYMPRWTLENIGKLTGYGKEKGARGIVQLLENRNNWEEAVMYKGPSIFVASSGMLVGGPSVLFARHILEEEASAVFFVGFLDEESPGKKLWDMKKAREKGGVILLPSGEDEPLQKVRVKCDVYEHKLSAHGDQGHLIDFACRWNPQTVILVHGPSRIAKEQLAILLKDKLQCDIYIPRNGEEVIIPGLKHCDVCGSRLIKEEIPLKIHPKPNLCSKFWLLEDEIDEPCFCGSKDFEISNVMVLRCPKKLGHYIERLRTGRIYKRLLEEPKLPQLPPLRKIKPISRLERKQLELKDQEKPSLRLRFIDTPNLLNSIVKYIHHEIEERIPFVVFCRLLAGEEYARYELLWKHGYSLVIDMGQNPEFSINKRNKDIILKTVSDLIYEKLDPPIPREVWDETEAPIHEREISALLFRKTPDGEVKVTLHNLLSRIDSYWKRQIQNARA